MGEPIDLGKGKALGIVLRDNESDVWIAENTAVVRRISLDVSRTPRSRPCEETKLRWWKKVRENEAAL